MPQFNYLCKTCNKYFSQITDFEHRHRVMCPICKQFALMVFNMAGSGVVVNETVGPMGVKMPRDLQKKMRERHEKHKIDHEAGEFIEKHGFNQAVKSGYVDIKEKKIL